MVRVFIGLLKKSQCSSSSITSKATKFLSGNNHSFKVGGSVQELCCY